MEELLHLRWLIGGALALLSIGTLFYLESTIWPLAAVASVAIVAGISMPALPARLPAFVGRFGVPAITAVFLVDVLLNDAVLSFLRLNVLLIVFRAVSYRTRREDLQMLLLCLFLVVAAGVLTVSIAFAVQILAFTAVGMAFLFIVNLIEDATGGEPVPDANWVHISRRRLLRRLWQAADLRFLTLGAALLLTSVGSSTLIFVVIPRTSTDSPLSPLSFGGARQFTGFSETVALGEVTDIAQDDGMAMRVDVPGADGPGVPEAPYWRMVVLDEYGQGRFRISRAVAGGVGPGSVTSLDFAPDWMIRAGWPWRDRGTPGPGFTVFMEGGVSRFLPLPGTFRRLQFREVQDLVPNSVFGVVALEKPPTSLVSYRIEGADLSGIVPDAKFASTRLRAPPVDAPREAPFDPHFRGQFMAYPDTTLAVPVGAPGRALLEKIVAGIAAGEALDAEAFVRRACDYLGRHHRYSRNVTLPAPDGLDDPVVRWLAAEAPGHCEFFAAALTLLSRTAGHPTRVVAGFRGGTWNAYENYFMVRNSDAHAWCEVYDGRGAWFRVDPTASAGLGAATVEAAVAEVVPVDTSVSAYIDGLRMVWYRRVVSFDQRGQRRAVKSLLESGREAARWSGAMVAAVGGELVAWRNAPWSLRNKGDLLVVLLAVLLLASLLRRLGLDTTDVLEWFRTGEGPTRRRAGQLLADMRRKVAGSRAPRWDPDEAEGVAARLQVIRFARASVWPDPIKVFRAARRLL